MGYTIVYGPTSDIWQCPPGVFSVAVECWGAGGAGGGMNLGSDGGGGGGGGAYARVNKFPVTPGMTYPYVVGRGGTGVVATKGNNGTSTTFNTTTCIASGGQGGMNSGGTPPSGGTGGTAGECTGDVKFSGGRGGKGRNNTTGIGGPGGSSPNRFQDGVSGPAAWTSQTGPAPPSGACTGGVGGAANADGREPLGIPSSEDTRAFGSGGGGAGEGTAPTRKGGTGGTGKLKISWTDNVVLGIILSS